MHPFLVISAALSATALAQDQINPINVLASALGETPDQLVSQLSSQYPAYTSQLATATGADLASIQTAISVYSAYTATAQPTGSATPSGSALPSSTSAAAQASQSSAQKNSGASIGAPVVLAMVAAGLLSVV